MFSSTRNFGGQPCGESSIVAASGPQPRGQNFVPEADQMAEMSHRPLSRAGLRPSWAVIATLCLPPTAAAQSVRFGDAVLSFGAEASGALSKKTDDLFNDTEYERSLLRLFRLRLSTELSVGAHLSLLAEVRSDNIDTPSFYALYLRVSPWRKRAFSLQVGQIPPVFGSFGRRYYAYDNPVIGFPLGYHYLTTVRDDASPASADDLAASRGHGAFVRYPLGSNDPASGLPLFNALRWDTGVQMRVGTEPLSLGLAVTQGTLSRPRVRNDNDGVQVAGRLAWRPMVGTELGLSGARGPYAETALLESLPPPATDQRLHQTSFGADAEYSAGYWLLRGEAIWTRWDVARVEAPLLDSPLRAFAILLEARYKLGPGLYAAARVDHLAFATIPGSSGPSSWDANVTRVEAGLGYSPWRRTLLKATYQYNWRDGGPSRAAGLFAGQVVLWF